ncbi:MAG: hypothetical protein E6J56_10950 [Deltaproteobacteria bacterium]|nr:MAG: hypothetical protein E6J56_10950 [Deltaproteobacteria bacterium]
MRDTGLHLLLTLPVLALGIMGMGGLGGGRETGLPAREFRATFIDADGTRVEATRVTAGGDTNLEGEIGRGRLRVPFDNIGRVRLEAAGEDHDRLKAQVDLREGEPVTLLMRSSTTFYGQTPSGAYQIRARDLKSIDFAR